MICSERSPKTLLRRTPNSRISLAGKMRNGEPYKVRVKRIADGLIKAKLLTKNRNSFEITPKGEKALKAVRDGAGAP
jgi:hypothetical protein